MRPNTCYLANLLVNGCLNLLTFRLNTRKQYFLKLCIQGSSVNILEILIYVFFVIIMSKWVLFSCYGRSAWSSSNPFCLRQWICFICLIYSCSPYMAHCLWFSCLFLTHMLGYHSTPCRKEPAVSKLVCHFSRMWHDWFNWTAMPWDLVFLFRLL